MKVAQERCSSLLTGSERCFQRDDQSCSPSSDMSSSTHIIGRSSERHASVTLIGKRTLLRECMATMMRNSFGGYNILELDDTQSIAQMPNTCIDLFVLELDASDFSASVLRRDVSAISQTFPNARVAVLSQFESASIAEEALSCGVGGFVTSTQPPEIVLAALRLILVGGLYSSHAPLLASGQPRRPAPRDTSDDNRRDAASAWREDLKPTGHRLEVGSEDADTRRREPSAISSPYLTPREGEVFAALQRGITNKVIAAELGLSENTVKVHIRHIMRKLGVTNRTAAALVAAPKAAVPERCRRLN